VGSTRALRALIAITGMIFSLGGGRAHASAVYVDLSGGVAQFHSNSPFFGPGTDNPSGIGYAANFGGYFAFSSGNAAAEIQLGLQEKANLGSLGSTSYSMLGFYPALRIQVSRIYLTGGATPWIYRGTTISDFKPVSGALSYLGEAGFLLPVTPRFSFSLGMSAEFTSVSGVSGPWPVLQVTAGMRIYWGVGSTGGGGGSHTSNEFRGWRYPFGAIR
jgi:hypothetical protein